MHSLRDWTSDQLKNRMSMTMRRRIAWQRLAVRQLTGRLRRLPNVLIIGGQRCGTSSLYKYLGEHPAVRASIRKETQYFTAFTDEGEAWYRAHFPLAAPWNTRRAQVCFEASPDYLLDPRCAGRAAATLGPARIIALLRDPVARAFSHYQHNRRIGQERLSFEDALAAEDERLAGPAAQLAQTDDMPIPKEYCRYSYVLRGMYARQLSRWLTHFSMDRVLVVSSEDFFRTPTDVFRQLTDFLEIDTFTPRRLTNHSYTGTVPQPSGGERMSAAARDQLRGVFREPNNELYELLGRRFDW